MNGNDGATLRCHQVESINRSGEATGARMKLFDYEATAELFPARSKTGRRPLGYRRFNTAAEAIRYAVEHMPPELLDGTVLESGDERSDGLRIRALYDSRDYPLIRK
jgi:hypothetical protein